MTDKSKPSKREIVSAYHEAGHAVVAHTIGLPVKSVTLTGLGGFGGNTRLDLDAVAVEERLYSWQMVRTLLAGVEAVGRMQEAVGGRWPCSVANSLPDIEKAAWLAEELGERNAEMDAGRDDVRRMLQNPGVWGSVERVAAELLTARTMDAARFGEIVNALTPREMERA